MAIRAYVPATDGAFAVVSERWGRLPKGVDVDADGTWHGFIDGAVLRARILVAPSPAKAAENAAAAAATAAATAKDATNTTRVGVLGRRAARYAKDPVANAASQLTTREMHELLARLAYGAIKDEF